MNKPQREIPTRRRFSKHAHAHNMSMKQRQSKSNNKNNSRLARTAHKHIHTHRLLFSPILNLTQQKMPKNCYTHAHCSARHSLRFVLSLPLKLSARSLSLYVSTCMIFLAAFLCVTTTTTPARSTTRHTHTHDRRRLRNFCSFIARTFVTLLCLCCANTL